MPDRPSATRPMSRPALEALGLLSQKWQPVVITTLHQQEPKGFSELLEAIPDISGKVLSETLKTLQESGLVHRREVSESPLRVEYRLTEAGRELEPIFQALEEWGERHLEYARPQVLLVDSDRRITDMYRQWLTNQYAVRQAHDGDTLYATITDDVDIVVLNAEIPGVLTRKFVTNHRKDVRTILLVGDRPRFDLLDVECDEILQKPIVRATALEAIEKQLSAHGESVERRKLSSLVARQSLFESVYPTERLEADERYRELCGRIEKLTDQELE